MKTITLNGFSTLETISFTSLESVASETTNLFKRGTIALSGGKTYASLYPLWVRYASDVHEASFFPVDERMVPFDDPQSNWGTAYRLFFKPLGKELEKAHAAVTVQDYEKLLFSSFKQKTPVFDVVFLGVGDDGHTAGLFPGKAALTDFSSTVLQTQSPRPPFNRITLGMAPLIAAKKVIVIIAGEEKKSIVERILNNDQALPIVQVLSKRKSSVLFVEEELL